MCQRSVKRSKTISGKVRLKLSYAPNHFFPNFFSTHSFFCFLNLFPFVEFQNLRKPPYSQRQYQSRSHLQKTTQQTMAAMTEAEMMAVLALDSSDSDSDGNAGGGSMIAPAATTVVPVSLPLSSRVNLPVAATEQPVNLNRVQDGMQIKLWRRVISFLSVREQAVSVRGMSRFFCQCSEAYMQKFWTEWW